MSKKRFLLEYYEYTGVNNFEIELTFNKKETVTIVVQDKTGNLNDNITGSVRR